MELVRGRLPGRNSETRSATFTGKVWLDPVFSGDGKVINNVFFEPNARSFWHRHEHGQLLIVTQGLGYVASREGEIFQVKQGDLVYTPPGQIHWHGAGPETCLGHLAISLGATEWLDALTEKDYQAACADWDKP